MKRLLNAATSRSIWENKVDTDDIVEEDEFFEFVSKHLLPEVEILIRKPKMYEKFAAVYNRPEVTSPHEFLQALQKDFLK